jgi:phospholipid-binding lipoprotein MlaA
LRRADLVLAALLLATAIGCATAQNPDPLEPVNRPTFRLNDGLDWWVLRPVGDGWAFVTPEAGRRSVAKVFANLGFPRRFLANLLEAEGRAAGTELIRFVVNTTVGLAGFFDPAGHWGIEPRDEDFGLAFGRWGVGSGAYLQLPVLGPSSYRDGVGWIFDTALDGTTWIGIFVVPGLGVLRAVNQRALAADEIAEFREASLELYVSLRNAYLQNREARVRGEDSPSPEVEDDLYEFDDDEEAVPAPTH